MIDAQEPQTPPQAGYSAELRDFAEMLCRALLMIVHYCNKRYKLNLRIREPD